MDEKDKNLGFGDFLVTKYGYEDDHTEYRRKRLKNGAMHEEVEQAQKRRGGHFDTYVESMDPRDFTDKAGFLVIVTKPSGKKMIKQYHPTSQGAQKYADRINKTNKVGHKATVHKTDGRKIMKEEVEQVDEVLSRSERLKRGQRMKRMSKRIQMAKQRALKRAPTMDVIQNRARKQAKNQMIQKWTRGADKSELSMGRRQELEKRLKKMGPKLDRMAKKLVPTIRKQDRERRSGSKGEE